MLSKHKVLFSICFLISALAIVATYLFFDAASLPIVTQVRLPRLLLAILAGAILGGGGCVFQAILNNPLADPYILGVSSGAALGSTIAVVSGFYLLAPLLGFGGALASMFLVWFLAGRGGEISATRIILAGIICGMFFSAFISLLMYLHQEDTVSILHVLMGSLGHIFSRREWMYFQVISLVCAGMLVYLYMLGNSLAILSSGDASALSLGVNPRKLRKKVIIIVSLLTGVAVAYAGIIGFVGLIIPHFVRMLGITNMRSSILISTLGGAVLLVMCDGIAMHIAYAELPTGIVTAFLGAPFFAFLMFKNKR